MKLSMSLDAISSLVYTSGGGNFMVKVWLIAGLLILTACNDAEGLSAEQLQEMGLASLSVQYSAQADDFFVETCD
jgi:hypothetical protein